MKLTKTRLKQIIAEELTRASDNVSWSGLGSADVRDADRILLKMLIAHVADVSPLSR